MTALTPLLLALFLTGSALAAPVPKEFKKKSDLDALQGEWESHERVNDGRPVARDGMRYVIEGNKLKIVGGKGGKDGEERVVTLTLDEKEKTYTWEASWGTWVGRYKLDGDTFSRASVRKGSPLPDKVEPGPKVEYSVYTRAKKAK